MRSCSPDLEVCPVDTQPCRAYWCQGSFFCVREHAMSIGNPLDDDRRAQSCVEGRPVFADAAEGQLA